MCALNQPIRAAEQGGPFAGIAVCVHRCSCGYSKQLAGVPFWCRELLRSTALRASQRSPCSAEPHHNTPAGVQTHCKPTWLARKYTAILHEAGMRCS
jgi:hypothetical protein